MNFLEMFIVVLAIILFTTAAVAHHRGTMLATDNLANASYRIQATQLAHEILDEIDAKLLLDKGTTTFDRLTNAYNPGSSQSGYNYMDVTRNLSHAGVSFNIRSKVFVCNALGYNVSLGTDTDYRRVEVRVDGPEGLQHPVSYSRVYTSWNL
ncbi:MAG: hypothetical protein PHD87_07825 [Candidatus Cloacimonetes bacterium]|nr:hypothetical protein [Candidatus Cloacimonadota bacterium]